MAFDTSTGTSEPVASGGYQWASSGPLTNEESKMSRIIVFAGTAGSGKDTAAAVLIENGFARAPLAGPLKNMLRGLMRQVGISEDTLERMVEGDLKEKPSPKLLGHTPRHAMQTLGTEWGRKHMGETFWLDTWLRMWGGEDLVVTDCRFANEAEFLKNLGAEVYLVKRPGFQRRMTHASEDLSWADSCEVIWNDFPTADEFKDSVRARFF